MLLSGVAFLFIGWLAYITTAHFYSSYASGEVQFRYHSNVFYGTEAVMMYLAFYVLLVVLSIALFLKLRKCFREVKDSR